MRKKNIFKGLGVALVTPFLPDGSVDYPALKTLTLSLLDQNVDFICVLGTTAETPCLIDFEKRKIIREVVTLVDHQVPLLLGCGGNQTKIVMDYLKGEDLSGIDGVLVVAPFYNKPSQEGLYQHFTAVAQSTDLPVVLYNVPGRTGVNIDPTTVFRIAKTCDNVVAIKEASGNICQVEQLLEHAPTGFEVISGDDAITLQLLSMGCSGVISVVGNAYPAAFGEMVRCVLKGDISRARTLHQHFFVLNQLLMCDGNPSGIKALLAIQGKINNVLRLPLVPVRKATEKAIFDLSQNLSQKF